MTLELGKRFLYNKKTNEHKIELEEHRIQMYLCVVCCFKIKCTISCRKNTTALVCKRLILLQITHAFLVWIESKTYIELRVNLQK